MNRNLISTFIVCVSLSTSVYAEDPKHFAGKTFNSITEAVSVFNDYNKRFESKLTGELSALDLHEIHELTYTMEDALAYITKSIYTVAEDLEAVHQATEYADAEKVQKSGATYLKLAREIVK